VKNIFLNIFSFHILVNLELLQLSSSYFGGASLFKVALHDEIFLPLVYTFSNHISFNVMRLLIIS